MKSTSVQEKLEFLDKEIARYQGFGEDDEFDHRMLDCMDSDPSGLCTEVCPIFADTRKPDCGGTPFDDFFMCIQSAKGPCQHCQAVAAQMVVYLKGLRIRLVQSLQASEG